MLIHVKLTNSAYRALQADLDRPHSFALERVGFAFARQRIDDNYLMLLISDYHSIPDDQYINDEKVGARINSRAIRTAMERSMKLNESILHIHRHDHRGKPRFSRTDTRSLSELIPSFHNTGVKVAHGALVFSYDKAAGLIWQAKNELPRQVDKITVTGYPFCFLKRRLQ